MNIHVHLFQLRCWHSLICLLWFNEDAEGKHSDLFAEVLREEAMARLYELGKVLNLITVCDYLNCC